MESNRLFIALGVLVALLGATFLAYRSNEGDSASSRPSDPWQRIDRAQITRIVVQRPGDAPQVELEKRDNRWVMTAPGQGPADQRAVEDALDGIAGMHVAATVARETSSHDDMEVDRAHAIHVQLFRGATRVFDGWVGRNLEGGSALRMEGSPLVHRVDRSIRASVNKEVREWRDRNITQLERDHVRSVEWRNARGTFRFDRSGDTWTGAASNPAIERLDTARVNQTVTNLLQLRATDFAAPNADVGITDSSPRVTINVDNGDPVVLTLGSPSGSGEIYVRKQGSDVTYIMARSHGEEIDVEPSRFQAPPPSAAGDGGTAATATDAAAAPSDVQLPPGMMERVREQLRQRGIQMPH